MDGRGVRDGVNREKRSIKKSGDRKRVKDHIKNLKNDPPSTFSAPWKLFLHWVFFFNFLIGAFDLDPRRQNRRSLIAKILAANGSYKESSVWNVEHGYFIIGGMMKDGNWGDCPFCGDILKTKPYLDLMATPTHVFCHNGQASCQFKMAVNDFIRDHRPPTPIRDSADGILTRMGVADVILVRNCMACNTGVVFVIVCMHACMD
jgi:hypothetical protein